MLLPDDESLLRHFWTKRLTFIPSEYRDTDFWPIRVAALFLGKNESAVRRMAEEGKIMKIKNCGTVEVYVPSVEVYLKRQNGFND